MIGWEQVALVEKWLELVWQKWTNLKRRKERILNDLGHLPKETVSQVEQVSRNTGNLFQMRCIIHHSSKGLKSLRGVLIANAISKHRKLFCVFAHLSILTRDDKLTFVWPTKYLAACHRKKIPCRTLWQFDLLNVYPLRDTLVFDITGKLQLCLLDQDPKSWPDHTPSSSASGLSNCDNLPVSDTSVCCLFLRRRAARRWERRSARRCRVPTWDQRFWSANN